MATVEKSWTDSTGKVSFVSSAAIGQYKVLQMAGNRLCAHTTEAAAKVIGVALNAATATGKDVDVLLVNHGGTCPGINASSVTAGAKVYPFAAGVLKASATIAAAVPIGVCVTGATVTGSRIEWLPLAAIKTT